MSGRDPCSLKVCRLETCRKAQRERGGRERDKTARKAGHTLIIPVRIKRRRGGAGVEMGFGVEEVGSCSVGRVCVLSSGAAKLC